MAKSKKDYWSQLTAYLTGGPIIAFWLWLTFAVIQQTAASDGLAKGMGFDFDPNSSLGFITQIGTAPQLASFIVAVVMLGAGLEATQSAVGALDSKVLSDWAKKAVGYRDTAFKYMARSPYYGTRAVGRGAFNLVDRKYNVSGQLGQGMARGRAGMGQDASRLQKAGGLLGDAARLIPGVGGVLATGAAGTLVARRAGLMGDRTKQIEGMMGKLDSLPPEERVRALVQMRGGVGFDDAVMGPILLRKQHDELTKEDNRKVRIKQLEKEAKAGIEADAAASNTTLAAGEADRRASAIASQKILDEERERINELKKYAKTAKDSVSEEKLKKEVEKKMLYEDQEEYENQVKKILDDPSKLKDLDSSVFKSGRFALAVMQQSKITDGTSTPDKVRLDALKDDERFKDQKDLFATVDLMVKKINGGGIGTNELREVVRQTDGYKSEQLFSTTGHGGPVYSTKENNAIADLGARGTAEILGRNGAVEDALDSGLSLKQIQELADAKSGAGATVAEVAKLTEKLFERDASGNFVKAQATILRRFGQIVTLAQKAEMRAPEMAQIMESALVKSRDSATGVAIFDAPSAMEHLLSGKGSNAEQQKQRLNIVRGFAATEGVSMKVADATHYLRKYVYPETETEIEIRPGVKVKRSTPAAINQVLRKNETIT